MFSLGLATVFIYLASLTSFLLGIQYSGFFTIGMALGGLLFIVASATLIIMLRKRMDVQDF